MLGGIPAYTNRQDASQRAQEAVKGQLQPAVASGTSNSHIDVETPAAKASHRHFRLKGNVMSMSMCFHSDI